MKAYRGSRGIAPLILSLGARWRRSSQFNDSCVWLLINQIIISLFTTYMFEFFFFFTEKTVVGQSPIFDGRGRFSSETEFSLSILPCLSVLSFLYNALCVCLALLCPLPSVLCNYCRMSFVVRSSYFTWILSVKTTVKINRVKFLTAYRLLSSEQRLHLF
jgi:hypothetical protein